MRQANRATLGAVLVGLVVATLILFAPPRAVPATPEAPGYRVLKTIVIGGTDGWDYIGMDSAARHLFIGRHTYMDVVDVDTGKLVAKLTGMPGVHGIIVVPQLDRGFTVNGKNDTSTILDLKTLTKIGTIKTGRVPDSYAYDASTKRLFIMDVLGEEATAINAVTGKVVGTIPIGGQPEFCVSDGKGHIFVNITDKNQMIEFDARTLQVIHRWPIAPCEGPTGLSMDPASRRLFTVCDNEKMVVINADTGKVVAALPTGAGDDSSLFDPYTRNAFASNGGCGTLTVIHEYSPDNFRVVETVPTSPTARTMALDTKTHDVILVAARFRHGPAYMDLLPNTFKVIVVGK